MMPSVYQLIVWAVVGLLGGSIASLVVTWTRAGFGGLRNFALGLAGALVGGFIFRVFGLFPDLDKISVSLRDVVAAFAGSLIILLAYWIWKRSSSATDATALR